PAAAARHPPGLRVRGGRARAPRADDPARGKPRSRAAQPEVRAASLADAAGRGVGFRPGETRRRQRGINAPAVIPTPPPTDPHPRRDPAPPAAGSRPPPTPPPACRTARTRRRGEPDGLLQDSARHHRFDLVRERVLKTPAPHVGDARGRRSMMPTRHGLAGAALVLALLVGGSVRADEAPEKAVEVGGGL